MYSIKDVFCLFFIMLEITLISIPGLFLLDISNDPSTILNYCKHFFKAVKVIFNNHLLQFHFFDAFLNYGDWFNCSEYLANIPIYIYISLYKMPLSFLSALLWQEKKLHFIVKPLVHLKLLNVKNGLWMHFPYKSWHTWALIVWKIW